MLVECLSKVATLRKLNTQRSGGEAGEVEQVEGRGWRGGSLWWRRRRRGGGDGEDRKEEWVGSGGEKSGICGDERAMGVGRERGVGEVKREGERRLR
jgi:hypothetical protein